MPAKITRLIQNLEATLAIRLSHGLRIVLIVPSVVPVKSIIVVILLLPRKLLKLRNQIRFERRRPSAWRRAAACQERLFLIKTVMCVGLGRWTDGIAKRKALAELRKNRHAFEPGVMLAFYFRRSGPQHRRSTQEPEKTFSHDVCGNRSFLSDQRVRDPKKHQSPSMLKTYFTNSNIYNSFNSDLRNTA